jgi:hypothetical protein
MRVLKSIACADWRADFNANTQQDALKRLELGQIILFPELPFLLTASEKKFLSPDYAHPRAKNISFNPLTHKIRCAQCDGEDYQNLKNMLVRFAHSADNMVRKLFPTYASALQTGRTSYRPVEIAGRVSSYRKDDTRLHVDAFPATPNQGKRILRVFANINPAGGARVWRVGEPFPEVAKRFIPTVSKQFFGKAALLNVLRLTKGLRTEYDHLMLQIHDRMKANLSYQKSAPQQEVHFTPGNTWIVQTDQVSHAAMAGQFVLEQTFYLPVHAMANPDLSPLRTLEKMIGKSLV